MTVIPASDRSLLLSFGDEISPETHRAVLGMMRLLQDLPEARNLHPAYASILVDFDPLAISHARMEAALRALDARRQEVALPEPRCLAIPVRYDGPDLADVAALNGLAVEEVVRIHSSAEYLVYFLGFSPGFPYLGGLPRAIATPRLPSPRKHVPAGSVAIGGDQTGVYPLASPGGWRIIGRTELKLFDPERNPPALLAMGDRVRFVAA